VCVLLEAARTLLHRAFAATDAVEQRAEAGVDVVRDFGVAALPGRCGPKAGDGAAGHQLPPVLAAAADPALRPPASAR